MMEIIPIKTRRIKKDDDLVEILCDAASLSKIKIQEGDIVLIVSKVVALTEGGLAKLGPDSSRGIFSLVEKEADFVFHSEKSDFLLTIKNGILTPNAGIDQSNIPKGYAIKWPKDSYASSNALLAALRKKLSIRKFGVLVFDSYITPLRNGVTGVALGYAGFQGVEDYRGKRDLFGKTLRVTQKNIADGLATAATLVTGEGAESIPFVIIRGASVKWTPLGKHIALSEIQRDPADCLYRNLYPARLLRASPKRHVRKKLKKS